MEITIPHFTAGWVVLEASLDGKEILAPPPEFDRRTVHPVARRYTDCAVPATFTSFSISYEAGLYLRS